MLLLNVVATFCCCVFCCCVLQLRASNFHRKQLASLLLLAIHTNADTKKHGSVLQLAGFHGNADNQVATDEQHSNITYTYRLLRREAQRGDKR